MVDATAKQNKENVSTELDMTLQAAYLPCTVSTKAAITGQSRRAVCRCSKAVMFAAWKQQDAFLKELAGQRKFWLSWERLEFDETKHMLTVPSHKDLERSQQRSAWSVMVVCHEVGWITPDGVTHTLDLLRLNKMLVGTTNAGCVWSALTEGKEFEFARNYLKAIRNNSDNSFVIWEPDAASGILKLRPHQVVQYRRSPLVGDQRTLFHMLPSSLHQGNHVVQLVCAFHLELIRGLHSLSLLLSQGNYFMRLVFVVAQLIRQSLIILHKPAGAVINKQK